MKKIAIILGIVCFLLTIAIFIQIKTVESITEEEGITLNDNAELKDEVLRWRQTYKDAYEQLEELEERLKKSTDAFEFYKNKYELGCNYLKVLGFENASKDSSELIKSSLDNTILEFNSFIEKNSKYFENLNNHDV